MFEGEQSPRTQERFDALSVVCWKSDIRSFNHSVLHTWDQRLQHHPRVHCVLAADGLAPKEAFSAGRHIPIVQVFSASPCLLPLRTCGLLGISLHDEAEAQIAMLVLIEHLLRLAVVPSC